MPLRVFISYAKEDRNDALRYYDLLVQEGTSPWIDEKDLLPGQNWEFEIEKASNEANVVVLLLSNASVSKRGFVRREANDAIERLRYKQPDDIYVLPLLLEPCEVPENVAKRLQYVDLELPGAWGQVRAALKLAARQQSIEFSIGLAAGPFRLFTQKYNERWVALPGHDISITYPRFESSSNLTVAEELSAFFAGRAVQSLINSRTKPWFQMPELFTKSDEFRSTSGRWDTFNLVHATDRLLSLAYHVGWYGAGAAHPNSYYETYTFCYIDRLYALALEDFFADISGALKGISEVCIRGLSKEYWQRSGEIPDQEQANWFRTGAGEKPANFKAFTVSSDHFTFMFPPYQVAAYALGNWSVDVSFYDLLAFLKPHGPHLYASVT